MFDKPLIQELYEKSGILAPKHIGIFVHMTGVMTVAGYLARKLNQQQQQDLKINVELIETAAMLHDIGKVFDEGGREHTIAGVEFLSRHGVDEKIICIVQRHQVWNFEESEVPEPSTWEEKLVFFGDLMFKDHIMPVKERVKELIRRYSSTMPQGRKKWLREKSQEIYTKISEILSPQPFPF